MFSEDAVQAESVFQLALAELSAFLRGTEAGIGAGDPQRRASAWIETFEAHSWPADKYLPFFRAVTLVTIIGIVSSELKPVPQLNRTEGNHEAAPVFISA